MKILFLNKRNCTNKDFLEDRFGRLYHWPIACALRGHTVRGVCLSYKKQDEKDVLVQAGAQNSIRWQSISRGKSKIVSVLRFAVQAWKTAREYRPDVIVSGSDGIFCIISFLICKIHKIKLVLDLYDDFENFPTASIVGLRSLLRSAILKADRLIYVSEALRRTIAQRCNPHAPSILIDNGIDLNLFLPRDKIECRNILSLPQSANLIGMVGALTSNRNINVVMAACTAMMEESENTYLVLAGVLGEDIVLNHPRIIFLGNLPQEKIALLYNALDLMVIGGSRFPPVSLGFPCKTYELLASRTPFVAPSVGPIAEFMKDHPDLLFAPESQEELLSALRRQLQTKKLPDLPIKTWDELANQFADFVGQLG